MLERLLEFPIPFEAPLLARVADVNGHMDMPADAFTSLAPPAAFGLGVQLAPLLKVSVGGRAARRAGLGRTG